MFAAALLLAGCEAVTGPGADPSAGPGPGVVDGEAAARLFLPVCIANLPAFAGTPATLAGLPVRQNSGTGTYYHRDLNLSFKLVEDAGKPACSLVYGTADTAPQALVDFATALDALMGDAPADVADVALDADLGPDGLTYVNARATAP